MKIAVLANTNLDYLISNLNENHEVFQPDGFGVWGQELVNQTSKMYQFTPQVVFTFLDGKELIRGCHNLNEKINVLKECNNIIENSVKKHDDIIFFFSNIDIPLKEIKSLKKERDERLLENHWANLLFQINQKFSNFYIFDLKLLVEIHGRKNIYSEKLWYLGGMKYSMEAVTFFTNEINKLLNSINGKNKKCLILDLDNTLWGGVIGEDGIDGIELAEFKEGARFKDFQKRIKELKELGIILAIVSKNNYEDAIEVLENHKHMILKKSDFVALKINWNHKVQNIKELVKELNLGSDSFIFIDDNPFERESVASALPNIVVPEFPKDTSLLENWIIQLYKDYFLSLKTTQEDKQKTKMYKQNIDRKTALQSVASLDDFLKTLKTKIKISKISPEDVSRVSQLTQKTNQFNLTSRRYTEKKIKKFMDSNLYDIYVASVIDKFGDNGMVSVIILNKIDAKTYEIDTFLMSCRIMERKIEEQILDYIEERLISDGCVYLKSSFIPTQKNKPTETFFERMKYSLMETKNDGSKKYQLELKNKRTRNIFAEIIER